MNATLVKIFLAFFLLGIGLAQLTAAQTCATAPIGLVSAYSGDNNALDARSRNNGTIQNNVTYAAGNVGQAFQLGGAGNASNSGDRVIVGNPANLRLQTFTVEAWVKRSSAAILTNSPVAGFVNGTIFAFGQSGWGIVIDQPTNRLAFTQIGVNNIISNLTISDTNWHHVAVSVSGTQVVFYLDGVADTPIGYTSTFVLTTNAAIGARGDNDARNAFFGAVDELAIYNRVLSASEIQTIFNAGTTGKCKPLATFAPENQVLWLAGDGDALDSSGNGNNGTLQSGASYAVGRVGQGFQFDGVDDNVSVPDNSILSFGGNAPMTVEIWVYRTSNNAVQHFIGKRAGCTGNLDYQLARDVTGSFGIGFNRGLVAASTTVEDVPLNTWTHLAGTYDGTTSRLYKNGVQIASATGASGVANSAPLVIGNSGTCQPFGGRLDEPSVYNRALSAAEIESIANAGLAGKYKVQSTVPTGLVAWFAGDSNANDISGNGNNATLAGGANTPTFTTAYIGQGFNHSGLQYATIPDSAAFRPQSLTIEGWAKSNSAGVQTIFSKTLGSGVFDSFAIYYASGNIRGAVCNNTGCVDIGAPFSLNVWHHVAWSYDDPGGAATKTARLYVDGALVATNATGGAIGYDTRPVVIGADIENGIFQFGWSGNIDEISFYNRALSATEIRDQFYAGSGGKYKGAINPTVSNKTKTGEATVTFGTITTTGAVHLTPIDLTSFPALPMGTNTGLNFDVSTNAVYTNPTVCFNMSAFTPAQFANLRVFHLESGAWQDRTDNSSVYPNLCSSGLTSLSPFAIAQLAPVAANVTVGGQILDGKSGISRAVVTLTDMNGVTRSVKTATFGFYRFDNVRAGETYIVSVNHKRYLFTPQVISVVEDLTELNFTAEP